jgi:hypothetical protein
VPPLLAIERDEVVLGLDSVEAKWGAGPGWRYYCVLDLEKAFAIAERDRESVQELRATGGQAPAPDRAQ